nr:sensor histidine kinase [Streptococcus constellatus]
LSFHHDVHLLPIQIEEHIFRIAQEIISNNLRHASENHLYVYLYQTNIELQLYMTDYGIGFENTSSDELSYCLKNMEESV